MLDDDEKEMWVNLCNLQEASSKGKLLEPGAIKSTLVTCSHTDIGDYPSLP